MAQGLALEGPPRASLALAATSGPRAAASGTVPIASGTWRAGIGRAAAHAAPDAAAPGATLPMTPERRRHMKVGAIVGAIVGTAAVAIAIAGCPEYSGNGPPCAAVGVTMLPVGAVGGAALGAFIGWVLPTDEEWSG